MDTWVADLALALLEDGNAEVSQQVTDRKEDQQADDDPQLKSDPSGFHALVFPGGALGKMMPHKVIALATTEVHRRPTSTTFEWAGSETIYIPFRFRYWTLIGVNWLICASLSFPNHRFHDQRQRSGHL